jgi:hypothetical protein
MEATKVLLFLFMVFSVLYARIKFVECFCRFVLMVSFSRSFLHHLVQVDNYPSGIYYIYTSVLLYVTSD